MLEKMINMVCVLLAAVAYWLAPEGYDHSFCIGIAMAYIAQNICWMVLNKKEQWIGFEVFFMISFFFVNFAYPVIYAPVYAHWSFFEMEFNRHVINQATAMAWLAYSCYLVGIGGRGGEEARGREGERARGLDGERAFPIEVFRIFCGIAIVGFGLFVATGGYSALKDVYSAGKDLRDVGIYSYFNNLFSIGALLMAATVFRLEKEKRLVYMGLLAAFVVILLSTGSRQFSISLVVVMLVSYSWYIYRLKGWQVVCIMLAGAATLFVIVQTRSSSGNMSSEWVSAWDIFEDLSINAINLYVLVDWGNSHDCTWLHGMLLDIVSPVPKLGTWLTETLGEAKELLHGGDLPSYILLGRDAHWGTGTNMVGEAYRSFGIVGMCASMWGIGRVIRLADERRGENIYWNVFYLLMAGHAVIYPRAPLLYDPRTIVWTMLLLWLGRKIGERARRREGEKARGREGEKRHVAYCIPALWNAGGMERVLTQKVNWLSEHTDWKVTILTTEVVPDGKKRNYFPLNEQVEVVEWNIDFNADYRRVLPIKWWNHIRKQRAYRKQLCHWIKANHVDVCISLCGKEIEWIGSADIPCRKIAEIHFAMDYREQWLKQTHSSRMWQRIGQLMTRALIRQVKQIDQLVVLTEADKRSWQAKGVKEVVVVPNPCSIMPKTKGEHDKKQILAVGRLEVQKGFDWLIEAWAKIEKDWPEWTLRICGEGSQRRELEKRIEELGLRGRVVMDGLAEDLEEEYQRSGLFVLSSRYEGLPLALMEAMSCGLCCIAMDCEQGPKELIENEKTGYLVPLGDIRMLADKIAQLLRDEPQRQVVGQAAAIYAGEEFALENIMYKWKEKIEQA